MIKKVTKTTVYKLNEKYVEHLKKLDKIVELLNEIQEDEEMRDPDRNICGCLSSLRRICLDAKKEINVKFTEVETEEHEEIID